MVEIAAGIGPEHGIVDIYGPVGSIVVHFRQGAVVVHNIVFAFVLHENHIVGAVGRGSCQDRTCDREAILFPGDAVQRILHGYPFNDLRAIVCKVHNIHLIGVRILQIQRLIIFHDNRHRRLRLNLFPVLHDPDIKEACEKHLAVSRAELIHGLIQIVVKLLRSFLNLTNREFRSLRDTGALVIDDGDPVRCTVRAQIIGHDLGVCDAYDKGLPVQQGDRQALGCIKRLQGFEGPVLGSENPQCLRPMRDLHQFRVAEFNSLDVRDKFLQPAFLHDGECPQHC